MHCCYAVTKGEQISGLVMKYQQLENLESGWKWNYLINKYKLGENITKYVDSSEVLAAIDILISYKNEPTKVSSWVEQHICPDIENKLKQAIRAKRKRHFDAEQVHTRKKSVDLDYRVWEKLGHKAKDLGATLSDTIDYLLSQSDRKALSDRKFDELRKDLSTLLKHD